MATFLDDTEKMVDFLQLPKEEFLKSYSYLTEQEYEETAEYFNSNRAETLACMMRIAENMYIEELNDRNTGMSVSSEQVKGAVNTYATETLSQKEVDEFIEICESLAI